MDTDVSEFPQKQTAVLPYSFAMWSCFPLWEKIVDEQTACMTALAVPYIVLMVFGFAVMFHSR